MLARVVLLLAHALVAFTANSYRRGPRVLPGPDGQAIATPREKMAQHEWGEWTPYSPCSRTCGAGVRYRSRYCVNFSSSTKFVTMPTMCPGEEQMYELCNTQPCETDRDDFTDRQCAVYNRRRLQGRFYRWRAHRIGD
ncbi:hypothetical protein NP493_463g00024 [Ridgeia piscesae]|uniref:Uncharacterized protein n=1 Tax=Ridgeia piscesae TaxID=27915 RepID=A0AAD9KZ25_RIDPI|nr:hypothetical protein NP493_463g00024 [Ridgeia piscesae]